jgi:uncharacterized protein YndB with AHSA1/START domain
MNNKLTFEKSITIQAPVAEVWKALTTPSMIKQYLFGTETITDWKKGNPITFQGVWQDKPYMDKGTIVDIKRESFLIYTYWSSFSNIPDVPENYSTIRYDLTPQGDVTKFTLSQVGFVSPEARDHSASNWEQVMQSIKKLVEESVAHSV